jgi:hypothetical protein
MLLQLLHEFATEEKLLDGIAFVPRSISLALVVHEDGLADPSSPWRLIGEEVEGKKGERRFKLGRFLEMPRFPGENNGGKAYFLAEKAEAVFGIDPITAEPRPDQLTRGQNRGVQNAAKAFQHFWQRIHEAHAATGSAVLARLLAFHRRYLETEALRAELLTRDDAFLVLRVAANRSEN